MNNDQIENCPICGGRPDIWHEYINLGCVEYFCNIQCHNKDTKIFIGSSLDNQIDAQYSAEEKWREFVKKQKTYNEVKNEKPRNWEKICKLCSEGEIEPEFCEYYGEPGGCNSPIYGAYPGAPGNCIKLRKATVALLGCVKKIMAGTMKTEYPFPVELIGARNSAILALEAQPRNCDVYHGKEAEKRFLADVWLIDSGENEDPISGWTKQMLLAYVDWLLSPVKNTEDSNESTNEKTS